MADELRGRNRHYQDQDDGCPGHLLKGREEAGASTAAVAKLVVNQCCRSPKGTQWPPASRSQRRAPSPAVSVSNRYAWRASIVDLSRSRMVSISERMIKDVAGAFRASFGRQMGGCWRVTTIHASPCPASGSSRLPPSHGPWLSPLRMTPLLHLPI
jgi:hypothetical protein